MTSPDLNPTEMQSASGSDAAGRSSLSNVVSIAAGDWTFHAATRQGRIESTIEQFLLRHTQHAQTPERTLPTPDHQGFGMVAHP